MTDKQPLLFINELENFTFHIDRYQRGFRWGQREIEALLKDISNFDSLHEQFYCLQPLVVKQKEGVNSFELIDGQQRCTTIFLILNELLDKEFYSLKYETRGELEGSNLFLNEIRTFNIPVLNECGEDELNSEISKNWKSIFILENPNVQDSVDNFYFFKAVIVIRRWLAIHQEKLVTLKENLLNKTKVIWYCEKNKEESVTNTFINFNDGKISLDQAELIKGLFVLDFKNIQDITRRTYEENQFASEWDTIEQHLKVESFWYFINTGKTNRELANKITLLLEFEKGKSHKDEDGYYTYRAYEKAFESDEKPDWRNLSTLYNKLEEWYINRETYHLIGACVYLTKKNVNTIVEENKNNKNKAELITYLKNEIKNEFFKNGKKEFKDSYLLDNLKYGDKKVSAMLMLYNIAVAHLTDKYYKFPFDRYRNVKSWNIEHIYAKNDKGFESKDDLKEWLSEIESIVRDIPNSEYKTKVEDLLIELNVEGSLKISNSIVKKVETELIGFLNKDSISNLCFLDQKTNIKVSNKIFKKKREMVLGINQSEKENYDDEENVFIPLATKAVFQKALTPSESLTMNYWNTSDRDAYQDDIKKKINSFLN